MKNKRRIEISVLPYILFVLGLFVMATSALVYLNLPEKMNYTWAVLGIGGFFTVLSIVLRPAILKEIFTSKKTALWLNDVVLVLAVIGIGVLLSHIGYRRNVRFDFTKNKMFSISDFSIKTLRNLKQEVKITTFFAKGTIESQMVKELLKQYSYQSSKIKIVEVDPFRDPMTTQTMNVKEANSIVVQCHQSRKDLFADDLFDAPGEYQKTDQKPKFKGEQALTSAILNVVSGKKSKVAFISGHGEANLQGFNGNDYFLVNELLKKENFVVESINLLTTDIATDTNLLVVIGPKKDFHEAEIQKIRNFVINNGNLLVALDPLSETENLDKFLTSDYGIMPNSDVVVDPRGLQRGYWTVAPQMGNHEITLPLSQKNLVALMFHCRSLNVEKREGLKAVSFLKSIDQAYAKRQIDSGKEIDIAFDEATDARGPFDLGVAVSSEKNASGSRIIVIGDSDFGANSHQRIGGNSDLFLNSVNWLIGQEDQISIRPKIIDIPTIVMDKNAAGQIFSVCVVGAPIFILLLGAIVFIIRRRV